MIILALRGGGGPRQSAWQYHDISDWLLHGNDAKITNGLFMFEVISV